MSDRDLNVAVIGGGFTGLAAAYELVKAGKKVTIFERDNDLGGLAATFEVGGQELEKFYHHWLGTDEHVFNLVREIGEGKKLLFKESKVGIYYANTIFRFSSPFDLLKFTPLPFLSRIRFGLSVLYAWSIKDMTALENTSAEEWLQKVAGKVGYETVWKPLLIGKFGEDHYKDVAAVWMWNKLIQRGQSRDKSAKEKLGYYAGGFSGFIQDLNKVIVASGGEIHLNTEVTAFSRRGSQVDVDLAAVRPGGVEGRQSFDKVIYTGHTPEFVPLVEAAGYAEYAEQLRRVKYLANVCLILESKASLSDIYWLNVNDPGFPFVGIIEHTNFETKNNYAGNHLIYLSKYLPTSDSLYQMSADEMFAFALPHLKRMFPKFDAANIVKHHLWRAEYAQPMITKNYPHFMPKYKTAIDGVYLCTMSQVYPEDRGTNYAVFHGREIVRQILDGKI
jgi:protoporphyrinogen oxidase